MNRISDTFAPIGPDYVGADFSNNYQLYNVLEWVLQQTGKATLHIVTFSVSEEFIRKMLKLKNNGLIEYAEIVLDFKAVQKTQKIVRFSKNVFNQVSYCKTHAKMIIIESQMPNVPYVLITGSQNATRGNRSESIIVTTKTKICADMLAKFYNLKKMQYEL